MYPPGHSRNTTADLDALLERKNQMLGMLTFKEEPAFKALLSKLDNMKSATAAQMSDVYSFDFSATRKHEPIDGPRPVGTASKL